MAASIGVIEIIRDTQISPHAAEVVGKAWWKDN
jgi:hypothetical protein